MPCYDNVLYVFFNEIYTHEIFVSMSFRIIELNLNCLFRNLRRIGINLIHPGANLLIQGNGE